MHRFIIPDAQFATDQIVKLPDEVLKHLRTVLRLGVGAQCLLCDGAGLVARAEILDDYCARVQSVASLPAADCHLTLLQGMPKGEKLELVLQKGTELGVNQFLLTPMARSVGRLKAERAGKRMQRWQKIVLEAARQSGQPYLPQVLPQQSFVRALTAVEADLKLLLWEESGRPLSQVLPSAAPRSIIVGVGPEGGITPEEAGKAEKAGYLPVSLGPRILRTETAGLAVMAILQYLYGDLTKGRCSDQAADQGKDES
jgi:16S rRNA (uracil1498-N3)-methyltransferase